MPDSPLPITTERLTIRAMTSDDAPALAAYRNDPDVARFQEWTVPFGREDAHRLIDGMRGLVWPVLGEWIQLAIDLDGRMIGDLGVHRSVDGRDATIGYTVSPDHQGHGYATEAVRAMIDVLFAESADRVSASIDPENGASARLLDRLGFRLVRHGTAVVRGESVLDDEYVLERGAGLDRRPDDEAGR